MEPVLSILESQNFLQSLEPLATLLKSSVDSGASLGFLRNTPITEFVEFWSEEFIQVETGVNEIIVAHDEGQIIGCVCLTSIAKATHMHRAEVRKLLVSAEYQGMGIATQLMSKLEEVAIEKGKLLLTLDTETNSSADFLYRKLGWTRYGIVPKYAAGPDGVLADCSFYCKVVQR